VSFSLHGGGVAKGVAIGPVHILRPQVEISEFSIADDQLPHEIARFKSAIEMAQQELHRIRDQMPLIYPVRDHHEAVLEDFEIASFIDPHMLMLEDSMLTQIPIDIMRQEKCNAEWALQIQRERLVSVFEAIDDAYLRARKDDIIQVVTRIQMCLLKQSGQLEENPLPPPAGSIVLADDLTPADTALMLHQGIKGFITEFGGATSHTAIVARSLGIPALVGVRHARRYIRNTDTLVIDGYRSTAIVNPEQKSLQFYKSLQLELKRHRHQLSKLKKAPAITQDGVDINLEANIEYPADLTAVNRVGASGIGLYRTEFLYMHRDNHQPPNEEEHYQSYLQVVKSLEGVVTIRTLDLGADKQVEGISYKKGGALATNPALGLRAVRLCLKELKLFKPQIRALLRVAAEGKIKVMIPMVSGLQEIHQVKRLFDEVAKDLAQEGIPHNRDLEIGAMVEIPSMALCTDFFLPHVDFLSIGTNDLIQYTLAIDRVDEDVSYLYNPLHPAVLRLLKIILQHAEKAEKPVSMCGEMAGDARYVRLLLGLGLRNFSVSPEILLEVKEIIRHSHVKRLTKLADKALKTADPLAIDAIVAEMNNPA
jgi:phosphoenolpyruvate-protein phosphotransferase (PTS system enzyme I)